MKIRKYEQANCKEVAELFYNTVHTVNAKDYTKDQLNAWADENIDLKKWNEKLQKNFCLVALFNEVIVGFGDIDETGYLDHLFVHKDYQKKGIASAICDRLEKEAKGNVITHSSITAKPFFEKRAYKVLEEQEVERKGIFLKNFVMEKER